MVYNKAWIYLIIGGIYMDKLKLDDFIKYKFLSGINISPDGLHTGFVVHEADLEENKYLSNIYIYNNEKEDYIQLTSFNEESSFEWKDNENILFPATRDKKDKERKKDEEQFTSFYSINIKGGEAKKAFEIPLNVNSYKLLDGENIIFTSIFDPEYKNINDLDLEEKEEYMKTRKEDKDYEVLDEIPYWANGVGFTNKKRNRLYIYNFKNKHLKPITDEYTNISGFELNVDRDKLVFIASSYMDKMQLKSDIYLYDIDKSQLENINHHDNFSYSFADFIKDKVIFGGHDMKTYGLNENPHIYTMDLDEKKSKRISSDDFDYGLWNSVGSDCRYGSSRDMKVEGDYIYFTTTKGHNSYINKMDLDGNIRILTSSNGSVDGFDIREDLIQFIGLRGLKLQEMYALKDEDEIQLTHFNDWLVRERKLSQPEHLSFQVDETHIDGWVMKPVDFKEGKKYPAILNIHGGPKTVFGDVFYHEMQYWANEGYVVFFCNPRGSDGKGNAFADIRGKYGTLDYDDIMEFTDLVLERHSFIDEDNIGVTGGSYGGFMTNWIIGHTDIFKAAASQRSISNWMSFFGTTDIGYYFSDDQQATTPWSDPEKLWFHSPMKYADKVTTPTLFVHSEEDYRCWLPEGLQMFSSLKYHGVDSRLVMFRGENHELSRSGKPKHRVRRLEEITNWFDNYLK